MATLEKVPHQLSNFQLREQIYFPHNDQSSADLKQKLLWEKIIYQWEQEGCSVGVFGEGWDDLPAGKHFESILDIGCGYGRHAVYLSKQKNITCDQYYGIDVSENMLRRLLKYKLAYNFFPSAEQSLICASAEKLPFEDNSIEFVVCSNLFVYMGKEQVKQTLMEIARVIRPGGIFIFESSFHNRYCPANIVQNLFRRIKPSEENFNFFKQYSLWELQALLKNSEFSKKCPEYTIRPNRPAIFPEQVGRIRIPAAKNINSKLNPPEFLRGALATGYSVYSKV